MDLVGIYVYIFELESISVYELVCSASHPQFTCVNKYIYKYTNMKIFVYK